MGIAERMLANTQTRTSQLNCSLESMASEMCQKTQGGRRLETLDTGNKDEVHQGDGNRGGDILRSDGGRKRQMTHPHLAEVPHTHLDAERARQYSIGRKTRDQPDADCVLSYRS